MKQPTFAWDRFSYLRSQRDRWFEWLWILGLLLAALTLFGLELGAVPLGDGGESLTAQVAREIARAPLADWAWFFPTLYGQPYFAGAPLAPSLIAALYLHWDAWTWGARLPGALLAACSVPLFYGLGRELFPVRLPARFAAFFYLTSLPVLRQGRLAGPGGAILCLMILALWCALRSRRDWRWSLGLGLSLGLLGWAHGGVAFWVVGMAIAFLAWDTPRLCFLPWFWLGLLLGSAPLIAGYAAQWWRYGDIFLDQAIIASLRAMVELSAVEPLPIWWLLRELASLLPALVFGVTGLSLLHSQWQWGWAKLAGVWLLGGSLAIAANLLHPAPNLLTVFYPAVALVAGAHLAAVWQQPRSHYYPLSWSWGLLVLGLAATSGCLVASGLEPERAPMLVLAAIALTLGTVALLLDRQEQQFAIVFFWGLYVSWLMLVSSSYWLPELPSQPSFRAAATLIRYATPPDQPVYTSLSTEHSALNFYSDRRVLPATAAELQRYWRQQTQPYFLLDMEAIATLSLPRLQKIARAEPDWLLVTKQAATRELD
ncbi:MAG: hypothetical protein HC910_21980 [Spirulinaceae cyanobacterium SM2_1_0]|nr:hypothetical protein [Spirulinaceae cyanobacterium SM2_1_0]